MTVDGPGMRPATVASPPTTGRTMSAFGGGAIVIRDRRRTTNPSDSYTCPVTPRAVDGVLDQIRAHGGRITTARRLVVGVLLDTDRHLSAEDITSVIRAEHPEVHLTTVYRTLESLAEIGIVAHTHLGHGAAVYHLGEIHQHLSCDVCGALRDVPVSVLDDLRVTLERDHQFVLHVGHFALLGRCAEHATVPSASDG